MPRIKRPQHRRGVFTDEQRESLMTSTTFAELAGEDIFGGEAARRAAWFEHRDELMAAAYPGRRPAAWWQYEAPGPHPYGYTGEDECAELARLGVLAEGEEAAYRAAHPPRSPLGG